MTTPLLAALPEEKTPPQRERFYHWLLLATSVIVGLVPVLGSLAISTAGVIAYVRFSEQFTVVGLLLSLALLLGALLAPAAVIWGFKSRDFVYGSLGLLAVLLLWPSFTFVGYLLSYLVTS